MMKRPRKYPRGHVLNPQTPPKPKEAKPAPVTVVGPKLLCCYPAAPLLKKYDDGGNYTMAGDLACRSELFMQVTLVGSLDAAPPYAFSRINNVYQCVLCGTMYRILQDGGVLMLLRDRWLKVDPAKGIIYLPDGSTKTVYTIADPTEVQASKQYIDKERRKSDAEHGVDDAAFNEFNV